VVQTYVGPPQPPRGDALAGAVARRRGHPRGHRHRHAHAHAPPARARHDAGLAVPGGRWASTPRRSTARAIDMQDEVFRSVTPTEPITYKGGSLKILLVDAGVKDNIVRSLPERGATVIRAPYHARPRGPRAGRATASCSATAPAIRRISRAARRAGAGSLLGGYQAPIFGVCLGNQILALAAGGDTYKLPYGHRGVNQPVQDLLTRRCYVTSQNHGYAVRDDALPPDWEPWFVNINDGTNEGIRSRLKPFFSVQFHPEASPGPATPRSCSTTSSASSARWRAGSPQAENVRTYLPKKPAASSSSAPARSDRPGRRVRLLGLAGHQGAARRGHPDGPHQPEHRDDPDERGLADKIHLLPVTRSSSRGHREGRGRRDHLSFGGQTALNCGLALDAAGILAKYGVRVLGTPVETIRDTEDRLLFIKRLERDRREDRALARVRHPEAVRAAVRRSASPSCSAAATRSAARAAASWRRPSCSTTRWCARSTAAPAGAGGGVPARVEGDRIRGRARRRDNCITVCNMENLDPMGIHTGESIVVAPSQTLNDDEYQMLRSIAIKTVRHLGIVGECNIQYALDPKPRLPRDRGQRAPLALVGARQQGHGLPARVRRREDRPRATPCPRSRTPSRAARRPSSSPPSTTSSARCRAGTCRSSARVDAASAAR
jgi:hypothetical protein